MQQTPENALSDIGGEREALPKEVVQMAITHKITLNVVRGNESKTRVLDSGITYIRDKILTYFFGPARQVFLLYPGETVESVVIKEVKNAEGSGSADRCSSTDESYRDGA